MRFYSKVTVLLYVSVSNAAMRTFDFFASRHYSFVETPLMILWLWLGGSAVAVQLFTYWEILHDDIYERRLWRKRTIPFDQIAAVKSEGPGGKPALNWLKVCYKSPFPSFDTDQNANDRGTLLLDPAHRSELLTALRHAAPQATFEAL